MTVCRTVDFDIVVVAQCLKTEMWLCCSVLGKHRLFLDENVVTTTHF